MSIFIRASEIVLPVKFIDTRFNLMDAEEGARQFDLGHIDGAVYWDLNKDLSDMTSKEGRHPMPSKEQLQELFESSGLSLNDHIVIYDQGGAPYSSRALFMLLYGGFKNVHIVNGGMNALVEAGFAITIKDSLIKRSSLMLDWQEQIIATRQFVKEITDGEHEAILLDARQYERYLGEIEPLDPVAGHIPTAKNFDWVQLVNDTRIESKEILVERFDKDERYVVYCGSGVTASPLFAALMNEGYENVQLYVGSYSDWITTYPVATGDEN